MTSSQQPSSVHWSTLYLVTLLGVLLSHVPRATSVIIFSQSDLYNVRTFSDGTNYYRYLKIDDDDGVIYVGGMERVYRLNMDNIGDTGRSYLESPPLGPRLEDINYCLYQHYSEGYDCKNHIRTLVVQDNILYGCGTGSFYPLEFQLDLGTLQPIGTYPPASRGTGIFKCPFGPDDSYACVYTDQGNPSNLPSIYAATVVRGFNQDLAISRPRIEQGSTVVSQMIRTMEISRSTPKLWINEGAEFIAAIQAEGYVYIFFNEAAVEFAMTKRYNVARVARICQNDLGGADKSMLEDYWTSYVKLSLNCSLPGSNPFYFEKLRHVEKVGGTFYALFTTPVNNVNGSALCTFDVSSVNEAFEGPFIEYDVISKTWQEVLEEDVPPPRPGTCNNNSRSLPMSNYIYLNTHMLMSDWLLPEYGKPTFYTSDTIYTKFVTENFISNGILYTVIYFISYTGEVHMRAFRENNGEMESRLYSVWQPFGSSDNTIQEVILSHGVMYLSTDEFVKQIDVREQCPHYTMCTDCVRDPHCGWDQIEGLCKTYEERLFRDVFGSAFDTCSTAGACYHGPVEQEICISGDPIYLECKSVCEAEDPVYWVHDNQLVSPEDFPLKYVNTVNNGMIVLNATKADEGEYICKTSGNKYLSSYNVAMPECTEPDCVWRSEFRHWCSEFEKYRKEFNSWLCVKNECFDNNNCVPNSVEQCSAP